MPPIPAPVNSNYGDLLARCKLHAPHRQELTEQGTLLTRPSCLVEEGSTVLLQVLIGTATEAEKIILSVAYLLRNQ